MSLITFITSNQNKLKQVMSYVKFPLAHIGLDLQEIQSLDLKEIATYKAHEAYKQIRKPVLVEDVSLTFSALGNLPGPFIKWFLKEIGNEKICTITKALKNSFAISSIIYSLYDGKELYFFEGEMEGTIAALPKGENGFGFDAIFIPKGYRQTRGEMNNNDYEATSPRKIALQKLQIFLETQK